MAVKIGDVTIRIGATTAQLEADLRKAERAMQASAAKFTSLGQNMTIGVTVPVLAAGAAAFKMASDYEESLNKVRVAFGSSATSIEDWSKTTLESIGIAEGSALDMAALFGDMATSMGLTQPAAADMSKSLVNLAGDLASFKNLSIDEVTTALAGVFTGETESLKRLGVVMTEANVQAFALEKGITKKLQAMSQAEKVALRYEYVLNATKNAQGDFARTADGAANQMRIVQESVKQLGAQFGNVLLPVLTPLIQRLNDILKRFTELEPATKKTIVTVAALAAAIGPLSFVVGKLISSYAAIIVPIVRMIASLTAQTAASTAAAAATTTAAAANTAAAASTIAFGTSIKAALLVAAPYLAIIGAIAGGIYLLYKNYQAADKAGSTLTDVQRESEKAMAAEKAQGDRLIKTINDESKSKQDKKKALSDLIAISPEYFKGLTIEKDGVKKINDQYNSYITNLKAASFARAAASKQDEIAIQILDKENRIRSLREEQLKIEQNLDQKGPKYIKAALDVKQRFINATILEIGLLNKESEGLSEIIDKNKQVVDSTKTGNDGTDTGISDGLKKQLAEIQAELGNVDKLFKAGLITPAEQAQQKIKLLEDRLKLLVTNGFKPQSKAVLDTKNQIQGLKDGQEAIIKPIQAFLQLINVIPGKLNPVAQQASALQLSFYELENAVTNGLITPFEASQQKIDLLNNELKRLSDEGLKPTSKEIQNVRDQLNELGVISFGDIKDLSDPIAELSGETLTELNKQITIIQEKTAAGLISQSDADVERINAIKTALNSLIEQGLGGTDAAAKLQEQLKGAESSVKTTYTNIFDFLGNKIASLPGIAEKLGENVQTLGPKIGKAFEGAVAAVQQVFSTFGAFFDMQEAKIDQFEEKEKERIANSIMGEEAKEAALANLNEKVLKKRKALARKQAALDKASALFSATIAGANAVLQAMAVPLIGPVLAKITAGLVAAQLAFIAATPLPSLAIGTDLVKSDGLAMIHKGEAIVPADVAKGGFNGSGGMAQVSGRIQGTDIILVSDYAMNFKNRIR